MAELQLCIEYPKLRGGKSPSAEFEWKTFGATDYIDAYAALYAHLVANVGLTIYTGTDILTLQEYETHPITFDPINGDVYLATAKYGRDDQQAGGGEQQQPGDPPVVDWDTTGGTQHVTQALSQRDYGRPGETPPDYKDAIGVTPDSVEGVDVVVPKFSWNEKLTFAASFADFAYARTVVEPLTGTVNGDAFRGFEPLDVLFMGARAQRRGFELVEVTYQFAASRTVTDFPIGDVEVGVKFGWDYLWATYLEEKDDAAKALVKRPRSVHVAEVYEVRDFATLGIGG